MTESLVANLLPNLAAIDSVVCPRLDAELSSALEVDHREIRKHVERIAIVTEAMSRSRRPKSETGPAKLVLADLTRVLRRLEAHEEAALSRLEATLSEAELDEAEELFAASAQHARAGITLVAQPNPAPTDAYVLRRRPDLDRAYATNLSDMERRTAVPAPASRDQ